MMEASVGGNRRYAVVASKANGISGHDYEEIEREKTE
jgi:hypothetical protein